MSLFKEKVIHVVRSVPGGKVVSYGQVAAYCGLPRAARQVGWILSSIENSSQTLPWWRVVNNKGYLSIRGTAFHDKVLQKKLLEAEGIPVSEEFVLPMEQYRFHPAKELLESFALPATYIERLLVQYGL